MVLCLGMQGTNSEGSQWNTIHHLVLSYLVLVKNYIDHDIYTLQIKLDNFILLVGFFHEHFICAYSIPQLFKILTSITKHLTINF